MALGVTIHQKEAIHNIRRKKEKKGHEVFGQSVNPCLLKLYSVTSGLKDIHGIENNKGQSY